MTAWAPQFDQRNKDSFNGRSDLRSNERFEKIGAWGPNPIQISEFFPDILISEDFRWTTNPAADMTATAVGDYACFWVWSPKERDYGVWALAAVDQVSMQVAAEKQAPVAYGWYVQIAKRLPTYRQMIDSGLAWQSGFFDLFLKAHPDQDPKRKKGSTLPPDFRTYEVVGLVDGQPVPLNELIRYVGGDDYEITVPGGTVAVADDSADGYNLSGQPGRWPEIVGAQSPAQFGLDGNKGVLFYNSAVGKGQVLSGRVLTQWFGPGWRREIYGSAG